MFLYSEFKAAIVRHILKQPKSGFIGKIPGCLSPLENWLPDLGRESCRCSESRSLDLLMLNIELGMTLTGNGTQGRTSN
jgi:hypothetical protein